MAIKTLAGKEYQYNELKANIAKLKEGDVCLGDPQTKIIDQGWIRSDPNILYIARHNTLTGKIDDIQLNGIQKKALKNFLK